MNGFFPVSYACPLCGSYGRDFTLRIDGYYRQTAGCNICRKRFLILADPVIQEAGTSGLFVYYAVLP